MDPSLHEGRVLASSLMSLLPKWSSSVSASPGEQASRPPSFAALYDEHAAFVWRSVHRLGIAEAEVDDVVQEVFLIVHRQLPTFEGRSQLRTWIFAILRRVVRDARRRYQRRTSDPFDDATTADPEASPLRAIERGEAARVLYAMLDELDADKREAFVLAELEGMTLREIAEATGTNGNTAYSRLKAAREHVLAMCRRQQAREAHVLRGEKP